MDEIPCAGINENTILLGIRIMENNAIQRHKNNEEKCHTKGRRNLGKMPCFRPEEIRENAML